MIDSAESLFAIISLTMRTITIHMHIVKGFFALVRAWLTRRSKEDSELIHAKWFSLDRIWFERFVFQHTCQLDGGKTETSRPA
jgi:hypothetical protein